MAKPLVLEVFCPQTNETAPAAGVPVNRQVRLQSERLAKDADLSKSAFDSLQGQISLTLQNLSADTKAMFGGGKKYKVTIEPVE
jgi:hypothetical protein